MRAQGRERWEARTPVEKTIPATQVEAIPLMADFRILQLDSTPKARKSSLIMVLASMKPRFIFLFLRILRLFSVVFLAELVLSIHLFAAKLEM